MTWFSQSTLTAFLDNQPPSGQAGQQAEQAGNCPALPSHIWPTKQERRPACVRLPVNAGHLDGELQRLLDGRQEQRGRRSAARTSRESPCRVAGKLRRARSWPSPRKSAWLRGREQIGRAPRRE